jgi:hypothetical protein
MHSAQLVSNYKSDLLSQKTVYLSQKEEELPIVINPGASFSMTPNLEEFLGPIEACDCAELNG